MSAVLPWFLQIAYDTAIHTDISNDNQFTRADTFIKWVN